MAESLPASLLYNCFVWFLAKLTHFISIFISKLHAHFQSMEVRNSAFSAYIDVFTPNTYVMVIMSDSTIRKYKHINLLKP